MTGHAGNNVSVAGTITTILNGERRRPHIIPGPPG
jgi:hypothetical protein